MGTRVPFVPLLKACARIKDLSEGHRIHVDLLKGGLIDADPYLASALVSMYARCGELSDARQTFDMLSDRNVIHWNALLVAYSEQGQEKQALNCFGRMKAEGCSPDIITYICVLKACGKMGAADIGKTIHDEIVYRTILGGNSMLGNALVDMYAKCGVLAVAHRVLDELPARDIVTWSMLIAGYAKQGKGEDALNCFEQMQQEGLSPNAVTFSCLLKACGNLGAAFKGKQIHEEILRQGLIGKDAVLDCALVDMYAKCGLLTQAQRVLDELSIRDVVSWNALITGYVQNNQGEEALNCFQIMQHDGLSPHPVSFSCVLKACGIIHAVDRGKQVHDEIVHQGLLDNNIILGTALVDMYAKCGALANAQQVLGELSERNAICWSALIAGYVQHEQGEEAMKCFERMQHEGFLPNDITYTCILKACGSIGAIDKGKQIHDSIVDQGLLRRNAMLGNALVDMYARCGALPKAAQVLDELPIKDVISWSALIAGYAQHGQVKEATNCLIWMQQEGLSPNSITFSSVLSACSRSGPMNECQMQTAIMKQTHGIPPNLEHYVGMVDLFGRTGHLDKVIAVIEKMPIFDYFPLWSAMLGICQKWGNVKLGKWAFAQAIQVNENDSAAYVLMANIFATAGMHEDAEQVESMRWKMLHGPS